MRQRLVGDAVIVEKSSKLIGAVRQRRDVRAHQRFGARATAPRARRATVSSPYSSSSAVQAPLAEIERVELAVEVAPVRLRHARVGRQDIDDVLLEDAARAISFTGGIGTPSWKLSVALALKLPGTLPPTSSQWPTEASQAEQLAVAEERPHEPEVVEMRAAVIGIVEQIGVAVGRGRRRARPCRSRPSRRTPWRRRRSAGRTCPAPAWRRSRRDRGRGRRRAPRR